jgi:hypothetical protein
MALSVTYPDKILAGLNHSLTLTSDEGPPKAKLSLGDVPLAHKLIPLGPPKTAAESLTPVMKYKLSFTVPKGSSGKVLKLDLSAGASKVAETKTVVDS